jgi:hypothetical protein
MQALIAYSIVAAALAYASWLLMPRFVRRWLLARIRNIAPVSQRSWMARLESAAEDTGCSTCKGCATDGTAAPPAIKTVEFHHRQAAGLKD